MTPLEALNEIKKGLNPLFYDAELCEIIETALKDLEFYEECRECFHIEYYQIREAFLLYMMHRDNRKSLKALAIIKDKEVNISALLELDNLQQYNDYCDMVSGCKKLTQEEHDLLKEVLK